VNTDRNRNAMQQITRPDSGLPSSREMRSTRHHSVTCKASSARTLLGGFGGCDRTHQPQFANCIRSISPTQVNAGRQLQLECAEVGFAQQRNYVRAGDRCVSSKSRGSVMNRARFVITPSTAAVVHCRTGVWNANRARRARWTLAGRLPSSIRMGNVAGGTYCGSDSSVPGRTIAKQSTGRRPRNSRVV
jgi:hypothetical protein